MRSAREYAEKIEGALSVISDYRYALGFNAGYNASVKSTPSRISSPTSAQFKDAIKFIKDLECPEGHTLVPNRLDSDAKSVLHGEFTIGVDDINREVTIPWSMIKENHGAIIDWVRTSGAK